MNRNISLIAAAVSAALASGYASAGAVTLAQASAPNASLVISGSSAAQSGLFAAITADVCGGASTTYTSAGDSKNFLAVSCTTAVAISGTPGVPAGQVVTIYYRTEGGSVVGALPIASGNTIKRLNLTTTGNCSDATHTCSVTKGTYTNTLQAAINDGWAGDVTAATTQLGVTDVEPGQLVGLDYPSNYNPAVFGAQATNTAKLPTLTTKKLFQQVFGLVVNTSGESFSTVNLSKSWAAKILDGNVTDWSLVPNAASTTGAAISSTPAAITNVDREPGSGTRTSANIFFNRLGCGSTTGIVSPSSETLNFSTGDELTLANSTPGAIAYTSIDQIQNPANGTKFTNLVLATIDTVAPSNQAAAQGRYDFWFEATLVPNTTANTTSDNISAFLQSDLPAVAKAPSIPDVNAIPGLAGNVKSVPPANNGKTGTTEIFVNPLTRGATSCNDPS